MKRNILDYFVRTVESYKNKVALVHRDKKLTFSELNNMSLQLSDYLIEILGSVTNKPICIFLPKGFELIISDIAAIYSCNLFNNLDVKTPSSRIKNIIDVLHPSIIITNTKYKNILENIDNITYPIINLDEDNWEAGYGHIEEIHRRLNKQIDTDPLCIINTSGSTGTPKGVLLTHRGFLDYLNWATITFKFNGSEILGVMSAVVFDHFAYEICLMMTKGSTLVLLDQELAAFPAKLMMEVQNKNVNYIFWVPTVMVNIANMGLLDKIKLTELKIVWFAGEVFPTRQFNMWRKAYPNVTFVNLYGPCEISVDCTYYIVKKDFQDNEPLPIGIPCCNSDVFLLNDDDKKCAVGEIGEICVRGSSLAMGYYNNPEKTQSVFVQNPLNSQYPEIVYRTGDLAYWNEEGVLMFKGRKDTLIKHMGNRVELGEIEHIAVNTLKLIPNCCVLYNFSKKNIVMLYESDADISVPELRKALGSQMPKYMVPSEYIKLEQMPRNTNGKIDRLALNKLVNKE